MFLSTTLSTFINTIALLTATISAQSVYFTNYPTQVVSGQFYPVSWTSVGAPVTVNLLRAGQFVQTLYSAPDASVTSFTWEVDGDDDDDGGIDFALQLVPAGGPPLSSGTVWIIGDDDGLLVNGQVIFASVTNGPTPSGLAPAATSIISSANGVASSIIPGETTQTVTFSSAQSSYVFVTTITASADASAPSTAETLTFVSNGLSFTTTINLGAATGTASSAPSDAAGSSENGGGIGGGAIAGIVIGVVVLILFIIGFLWFRRRRQRRGQNKGDHVESPVTTFIKGGRRALSSRKSAEKDAEEHDKTADQRHSLVSPVSPDAQEMESARPTQYTANGAVSTELDGKVRHEMNAAPPRYELAAEDVSAERGSPVKYPATCESVSRAGTTTPRGVQSNTSVSGVSSS